MNIGVNLKAIRNYKHLSQTVVANKLGVTRQAISQWEHNYNYPDIENLVELSQLFNCDINKLLFGFSGKQ